MQAARHCTREIKKSLERDHRVFVTPLAIAAAVFVAVLGLIAWDSLNHMPVVLPSAAPLLMLWLTIGIAGFLVPIASRIQRAKLDEIKRLKAAFYSLAQAIREAIKRGSGAAVHRLAADLDRGLIAFLALPPPSRRRVQHVCLTPRILAQRPSYTRVPRG